MLFVKAGDVAELIRVLLYPSVVLGTAQCWSHTALHKLGLVEHAYNPSTQ